MNKNTRIKLEDSMMDVLMKMSEGNPGASVVLVQCMEASPIIDPQAFMGPLSPLLNLDSLGVYGSDIWVLYKDCCGGNIILFLAVTRSVQMGLMSESEVKQAINSCRPIDAETVMKNLQARLPQFNKTKYEPYPSNESSNENAECPTS